MEYYFVNQHLEDAVQVNFLLGKSEYSSNTEVILEYVLVLVQNLDKETDLAGELLCQLIRDELEVISRVMAQRNHLSEKSVIQIIKDNCISCAHRFIDVKPKNILSLPSSEKHIGVFDKNKDDFRRCCLSLARGVPISKAFDKGPDLDGLMIWLVLGSLYCATQIIEFNNRSLH